jgi:Streptomyces sporulation and cell division protein, SsgA
MSLGVAEMSSSDRNMVWAEQELRLIGPEQVIVPLTAEWAYSRQDPYAVVMSLDTHADEPVQWTLCRDLLAAALLAPQGIGDVRAWPSASGTSENGAGAGEKILNIVLGPPNGCARFETDAAGVEAFLARAYELVPAGQEPAYLNIETGLAELLSQA